MLATFAQKRNFMMTREEILSIELQTRTGTAIRIQGVVTPAHLRELIAAGNV